MCLALFFVGNDSMWFRLKRCGGKIPTQNRFLFGDKKRTLKSSNNQKICHYTRARPQLSRPYLKGNGVGGRGDIWRTGTYMYRISAMVQIMLMP